jgi:hypothetical protein
VPVLAKIDEPLRRLQAEVRPKSPLGRDALPRQPVGSAAALRRGRPLAIENSRAENQPRVVAVRRKKGARLGETFAASA